MTSIAKAFQADTSDSAHAFDIAGARTRLCAAEGGYEIVHESRRLQICVYALVAPEPDRQRVNVNDELSSSSKEPGYSTSAASSSSFAKGAPRSSPPAPITGSAHTSTSLSSQSSEATASDLWTPPEQQERRSDLLKRHLRQRPSPGRDPATPQ